MNDDAFSALTPESSYWIGFLMADGSVDGKSKMTVSLQLSDADHLEKLKAFLKASYPVRFDSGRNSCTLAVHSKKIVRDLESFGIVPRKSYKDIKAHVDLANNRDFWRGLVDGDGSVLLNSYGKPLNSLVGCRSIVDAFAVFSRQYCLPDEGKGSIVARGSIWSYAVTGKSAIEVIKQLYYNSVVALDRKKAAAEEILSRPVDFYKKLRPRGEDDHNAKLTWENVREIRAARGVVTQVDLAKKFEVSKGVIGAVQLGKTWIEDGLAPVESGYRRGEASSHAKLTWEKVEEIHGLKGTLSGPSVARRYGVSDRTIYAIWQGLTWKQAPEQDLGLGQ